MENSNYIETIKSAKQCKGLKVIGEAFSGALIFEKQSFDFENFTIKIIRTQWTKTQGGWGISVDNWYTGKKHQLRLPIDTLKQARQIIELLIDGQNYQHWTGHVFLSEKIGQFIKK